MKVKKTNSQIQLFKINLVKNLISLHSNNNK